jgi:hypothetical protein
VVDVWTAVILMNKNFLKRAQQLLRRTEPQPPQSPADVFYIQLGAFIHAHNELEKANFRKACINDFGQQWAIEWELRKHGAPA